MRIPLASRHSVPLFVLLLVTIVFGSAARNGFLLDDVPRVRDNPLIRELANVPTLFASDYSELEAKAGLYRPLVTTSYALNYAVGKRTPWGYSFR